MRIWGFALAAFVLVVDQATKLWALDTLQNPRQRIEVLPFWDMVLVWNRGVSFGLLGGGAVPPLVLVALTGAIAIGVAVWLFRSQSWYTVIAAGFILGGAIGNIIDRLVYGAVVDFIDWHAFGYHWPVFNVADAGITMGVLVLLAEALLVSRTETR
ncbi:MAG TPA: signal peptidase II [Alphaproteobacteria bacterium]|nr:signal peptidase II [Alphaproteobacteria bacterium]